MTNLKKQAEAAGFQTQVVAYDTADLYRKKRGRSMAFILFLAVPVVLILALWVYFSNNV